MNASTQKVPEETAQVGHHGGSDDEHRCWRCALKKAFFLGAITAVTSFAIEFMPDKLHLLKSSFSAGNQGKKSPVAGKAADCIHRVVVLLDELSGRSTEVH